MKHLHQGPEIDFQPHRGPVPLLELQDLRPDDLVIDVRAPAEFAEDHLPGAVNVPLLNDLEREKVGALFRVKGSTVATDWALNQLRSRLKTFLGHLEAHIRDQIRVVICCARGGDRSRHVVQFLVECGHQSMQLVDGYRGYRKSVRRHLAKLDFPNLFVLDGLTGTGKTKILRSISKARPHSIIDLEGYADHRSSILGDVGLNPVSQKRFESRLFQFSKSIGSRPGWILVEAESRKVGNREIPLSLWQQMQSAPRIQLYAEMELRCQILEADYQTEEGWGPLSERIRSLGPHSDYDDEEIDEMCAMLERGDTKTVAENLLERHYDPRYSHQMKKHRPIKTFEVLETDSLAAEIVEFLDRFVANQGF